ncbi:MAG: hypothetical protein ACR2ND_12385 [Solirubrobacteraceae bacterium]
MSRQAIAAALARKDLAGGERLVAFSLASFAGRDGRAWPGAPAAAARAGLSRSRYLHVRDQLVGRGLLVVEEIASGRGRASTVALEFVAKGPWWEGEINAELFEAVLSHTRTRGPARLLLAAMAAFADPEGVARGLSSEALSAAAGVADRTYRRARHELLESGELTLLRGVGGRGNTNVWEVRAPTATMATGRPEPSHRRVTPPAGARPMLATVASPAAGVAAADPGWSAELGGDDPAAPPSQNRPVLTEVSDIKGGQGRTVSEQNCPARSGVSAPKGGQDRTLFDPPAIETPAQTPAETPAANARAGRDPQNPRIEDPPNPPGPGGSGADSMIVEQTYVTERGRRRRRTVRVDLHEVRRSLGNPTAADRRDWQRMRELLEATVGESTFAIWLGPADLIAVDGERRLVVAVPAATVAWTSSRFGRLLESCAVRAGRELRFASEPEVHAFGAAGRRVQQPRQEVAG